MPIYQSHAVREVISFYGPILNPIYTRKTIYKHLETLADLLWQGIMDKNPVVHYEVSNYHPDYLGASLEEIQRASLGLTDARQTIASEYGFANWEAIRVLGNKKYDLNFELAVHHLLRGNLSDLEALLSTHPELVEQKSSYGHQATLLHYVGSNGVEIWRQQVPQNLPALTKLLLDKGADKTAQMVVYGGTFDTLSLLDTSAHPFAAGVANEVQAILG